MPLAFLSLRESSFVDWKPVDELGVWIALAMSLVDTSSLLLQRYKVPPVQLVSGGACMSHCWNETMMNVADTSRQQEIAPVRNEVQQARETVINGFAGTSGLC